MIIEENNLSTPNILGELKALAPRSPRELVGPSGMSHLRVYSRVIPWTLCCSACLWNSGADAQQMPSVVPGWQYAGRQCIYMKFFMITNSGINCKGVRPSVQLWEDENHLRRLNRERNAAVCLQSVYTPVRIWVWCYDLVTTVCCLKINLTDCLDQASLTFLVC